MSFKAVEYIENLVAVGVPDEQAKVQAKTLESVIDSELATKRDLKELEYKLTIRMGLIAAGQVALIAALVKLL